MTPEELGSRELAAQLQKNLEEAKKNIAAAGSSNELEKARNKLIGKASYLAELRKTIATLDKAERPQAGQMLNEAQEALNQAYERRLLELNSMERDSQLINEQQELTEIILPQAIGHLHPVTQMQRRLEDVFMGLGFEIKEGPEVETEWNNFEALNFPPGHPARDMYDTFYVDHNEPGTTLLRTHTSPVQVRTMLSQKPPIYIVAPGRCYRQDTADATHMPVFHQIEGLVVDKGIVFGDLAGLIEEFTHSLFGSEFTSRLRPSYFPFTEPSAEFDILVPQGYGKNEGKWLELGGCGMVHPEVFKICGINPEEYTGFAFGFGIDRLAMMEFGIDDLREFWNSDIRFLEQF